MFDELVDRALIKTGIRETLLIELHQLTRVPNRVDVKLIRRFMRMMNPIWVRWKDTAGYFKASDTFEALDCVLISEYLYAPR